MWDGVEDSLGNGVDSSVCGGRGVGVGTGLPELLTYFARVQNVVGPFKKRNSVGLSGVDALINITISCSSRVRSLIWPSLISLAMPSLSCCDDKLITSFKVCSESKYTEPTAKVSAKTGPDVMNKAMRRNLLIASVTASDG